jgi:hypothetical protein
MSSFEQAITESFEAYMRAVSEKFEIPYDALYALWKGDVKTEGKTAVKTVGKTESKAKVKKSESAKSDKSGEVGCQKKLERGANKGQPCSKPTKNGAKYCSRHSEKDADDDAKSVVSSTSSKIKRVGTSAKKEVAEPPPVSDSDADADDETPAKKVASPKEASPVVAKKEASPKVVSKKEASPKVAPKKVLPPPELADVSTDEDDD